MNIYDVVIQRRRALKDLFDSANRFMEPTEREKMLMQHKNDLEKMALKQKNDLDMYALQTTTDFAQDMAKSKLDFDKSILEMGLKNWHERELADLRFNRDLELERLKQVQQNKLNVQAKKDAEDLQDKAIEKQEIADYNEYLANEVNRRETLASAQLKDKNVAHAGADYSAYEGGWAGRGVYRGTINVLNSTVSYGLSGAVTGGTAGAIGGAWLGPGAGITAGGGALTMGAIGAFGGFVQSFGELLEEDSMSESLGIGVEEYGWEPKTTRDFANRTKREINKEEKVFDSLWEYNRSLSEEDKKAGKEIDIYKFKSLMKTHNFNAEAIYKNAIGQEVYAGQDESGQDFYEFKESDTMKALTLMVTGDLKYMLPMIESTDETTPGGKKVEMKPGLGLPFGEGARDESLLWGAYDGLIAQRDVTLSEPNIALVRAYMGDAKAQDMVNQKNRINQYIKWYDNYFKDAYKKLSEEEKLASFSRLSITYGPK